jgi:virulence factor Mce-like protein
LVVVLVAYMAFAGALPFAQTFQVHVRFADANELTPGNPVRIAGLQVGSVASVDPGPGTASTVNIALDQPQLIHADAIFTIKPRLLFEGNNYIDVSPGTPTAPAISDGATVPVGRSSSSVGLQQLLDVFQTPVRTSLRSTIAQLASGLGSGSSALGGATHVPLGYQGLRDAARELDGTLASLSASAQAARGTSPGDLHASVENTAALTSQLAVNPAALSDFVSSYDQVFGTLAAQSSNLEQSLRQLLGLLSAAPPQLRSIDTALPTLSSLATALRPVLRQAPSALTAGTAALDQIGATVAPPELPKLLSETGPLTAALPTLESRVGALMPRVTLVAECVARNIVPALDRVVPEKINGSGRPAWQDLVHLAAALAGASPGFDGNGTTIRLGITENEVALASTIPGFGRLIGTGTNGIAGVQPLPLGPGIIPPLRPDAPCITQPLPNLSLRSGGPPSSIAASRAPAPSALTIRLARELLSGTATGRHAALSQLLALLPTPAQAGQRRVTSRPAPPRAVAQRPVPTNAPVPGAGTPLPPLPLPPTSSLGQTLKGIVGGLLGRIHG